MRGKGRPLQVRFAPGLEARRGRLLEGAAGGTAVHAGGFPRRREIVLDAELLRQPGELARILVHEIFHFVWPRLDNATRRSWERLLVEELRRGARGELGWSAESRKRSLAAADRARRTRRWREYACESFCDTAAWLAAGGRAHEEFTLAASFRRARRDWFRRFLARPAISI